MAHNVTIRFDFSDTSKYASIPLYIGVSATFTTIFIYIQSELSPLDLSSTKIRQRLNFVSERLQNIDKIVSLSYIARRYFVI